MTPAIEVAREANLSFQIHEYEHDPSIQSYGEEAAAELGVDRKRVFKTLVVELSTKELCVYVLPIMHQLNMKSAARVAGVKKATMANAKSVVRVTGYVLGGVSPIGQKRNLRTFIDTTAGNFDSVYVSGGRRGLDIELNILGLVDLLQADMVDLC
jgi:Cys-tRNA(Pro)/Cys-tRNA(Cys) deacylase